MINRKKYMNCMMVQFSILWKSIGTKLVLAFIMIMIVYNYISNIMFYYGADVNNVPQSMFLNFLSMEKENGMVYFFLQLIPFLVVIPGGFSYVDDKISGVGYYFNFRVSKKEYIISKMLATFVVTFLVFEIPQLLEILLNMIAFPFKLSGSPSGMSIFEPAYISQVKEYWLYKIMVKNPYVYAVLMTLKMSLFAGVMSLFALAVSTFGIRIKVFVFLPGYLLLYMLGCLRIFFDIPFNTNYFYYLLNYVAFQNLNYFAFNVFLLVILLFSISVFYFIIAREEI